MKIAFVLVIALILATFGCVDASLKCSVCLHVCRDVQEYVDNHGVHGLPQRELDHYLEGYCKDHLSGEWLELCDKLVDKFAGRIAAFALRHVTAETICHYAESCTFEQILDDIPTPEAEDEHFAAFDGDMQDLFRSTFDSVSMDPDTAPTQAPTAENMPLTDYGEDCDHCKMVINLCEDNIRPGESDERVEAIVDQACQQMRDAGKCERFVEKHGPELVKQLQAKKSAKSICREMKLCRKYPWH